MMPLVIAFFLSFVSPSYSELPSGSFFSFHSKEFFYTVDSDSVFVTKNGKSYDTWAHKMDWPHFDFDAIHRPNETILVTKGVGFCIGSKTMLLSVWISLLNIEISLNLLILRLIIKYIPLEVMVCL